VASASPRGSSRARRDRPDGGTHASTPATHSAVTGGLIQNTARQPSAEVISPPSSGPAGSASEEIAAHTPRAFACSARPGNASAMAARLPGSSSAAPAPCPARAAISAPGTVASAHPAEAAPKITRPGQDRAAMPETVPQHPAGQQQAGEGDRVAVHHPLHPGGAGAQADGDRGDGDGDDGDVEQDQEHPAAHDEEHQGRFRFHVPTMRPGYFRGDGSIAGIT
jgi:hypothetical protein